MTYELLYVCVCVCTCLRSGGCYYGTFIHGHGITSTKIFQYEHYIERLMPLVLYFFSVLAFNCA